MTVEQLQKPNMAAKLITKFSLTPPASDRVPRQIGRAGARGPLIGFEPVGLTLNKADELLVANAGDDSVLLYDVEGRLIQRIDQRQLLHRQHDDDSKDDDGAHTPAAAAADKRNNKSVSHLYMIMLLILLHWPGAAEPRGPGVSSIQLTPTFSSMRSTCGV